MISDRNEVLIVEVDVNFQSPEIFSKIVFLQNGHDYFGKKSIFFSFTKANVRCLRTPQRKEIKNIAKYCSDNLWS
jgi:hypothetical protein